MEERIPDHVELMYPHEFKVQISSDRDTVFPAMVQHFREGVARIKRELKDAPLNTSTIRVIIMNARVKRMSARRRKIAVARGKCKVREFTNAYPVAVPDVEQNAGTMTVTCTFNYDKATCLEQEVSP